jgi:ABC-type uncharacterized transport system permease subunit
MTADAITSITNFLLAAEVLFLAGRMSGRPKVRFSAAWYFSGVLLLLGVAALLGGIDHGFFEPANMPRYLIQRSDWIVLGGVTFCLLMTTAKQFFPPAVRRVVLFAAVVQFAANTAVVLLVDSFLDVILNYGPVMLLLLIMSCIGLRGGRGSPWMAAGILILFAASGIQAAGVDVFTPLDRNGLYHLLSMIGVAFLYLGGVGLRTKQG